MTTTDPPRWDAIVEIRGEHFVLLVTCNGEPAGMITLPEEALQDQADFLALSLKTALYAFELRRERVTREHF